MSEKKSLDEITKEAKIHILKKTAAIDIGKYDSFMSHECDHIDMSGDITEGYTYHFTETSVGTAIKISCKCGYERDITDYGCW